MAVKRQANLEVIGRLAEAAASIEMLDAVNILYQTALHLAVILNRPDVVYVLVSLGASLRRQEQLHGDTALHLACRLGHGVCLNTIFDAWTKRTADRPDKVHVTDILDSTYNYEGSPGIKLIASFASFTYITLSLPLYTVVSSRIQYEPKRVVQNVLSLTQLATPGVRHIFHISTVAYPEFRDRGCVTCSLEARNLYRPKAPRWRGRRRRREGKVSPLPSRLGNLGERRKLRQRGPGHSPGQNSFVACILMSRTGVLVGVTTAESPARIVVWHRADG